MDDFVDPFLSSSSWSQLNTSELNPSSRSSWAGNGASQTNGLLASSGEAFAEDEKNTSVCVIPSTHITENVASEDLNLHAHSDNSSVFTDGTLNYLSQHENETQGSNLLLNSVFESNSISGSYGQELNTLTMSSSVESNASDACKFGQPLGDSNSISSVPSIWPPSYSSVPSIVEQVKLQGFDFQGMENDDGALGKAYSENGNYSHMNNFTAAPLHDGNVLNSPNLSTFNLAQQLKLMNGCLQSYKEEENGLHNLQLPIFPAGFPLTSCKPDGLQAHQQSTEANSVKPQANHSTTTQEQTTPANTNGPAKPRVRARRGQATDPHSIAERLRREKISERMKNLQELVPNSNKADKASMLDEIIDYVKFLQLQVKVLSMSRLGAAGAVVPLITDLQAEASSVHLSSPGLVGADLSAAEENLALEQEVVKLMESNVTTAMQYLQNKGLCLMPIALASAISSHKGTSSAAIPPERRNPDSNGRENGVHIKQEAVKSI